jgi:hypothetical protein
MERKLGNGKKIKSAQGNFTLILRLMEGKELRNHYSLSTQP